VNMPINEPTKDLLALSLTAGLVAGIAIGAATGYWLAVTWCILLAAGFTVALRARNAQRQRVKVAPAARECRCCQIGGVR